jgi:hypothetical protein
MVLHPIEFWAVSEQPLPWRYNIPHGSFFCLLELPLPFRYGALFQPLDIHTTSEQTRSKEYYSRTYLSAFIPPLKGVGFLRYMCNSWYSGFNRYIIRPEKERDEILMTENELFIYKERVMMERE